MLAFQASLLDLDDEPGLRPLRRATVCGPDPSRHAAGLPEPAISDGRTELADGAWVELQRSWLTGANVLFERLLRTAAWQSDKRPMYDQVVDVPRVTAFYDEGAGLPDPVLGEAMSALSAHYRDEEGSELRTAGLCLYRDGSDSVAWHGDTVGAGATADVLVAIVSLGATRRLLLRPRGKGRSSRVELSSGDLLVMGGSCQRTFEHSVPKTARAVGPRISVQLRPAGVR